MDDYATRELGMGMLTLMENAGKRAAELAASLMGGNPAGRRVAVLVGKGNKGGDALVAARHLSTVGAEVVLVLAAPSAALSEAPALQFRLLAPLKLRTVERLPVAGFDLVVDGLLGSGSKGPPREAAALLIKDANARRVPKLALDLPSGLDPDSGEVFDPCISAHSTLTFALPKVGFLNEAARQPLGELYLADIGLPAEVYQRFTGGGPPFGSGQVVRVW